MSDLYVCNRGKKDFADRYDGVDYVFEVGETVPVPLEAARHIFGYGCDAEQRHRALVRQGVVRNSNSLDAGKEWLGNFVFEEVAPPPPPVLGTGRKTPRRYAGAVAAQEAPEPVPAIESREEPLERGPTVAPPRFLRNVSPSTAA